MAEFIAGLFVGCVVTVVSLCVVAINRRDD